MLPNHAPLIIAEQFGTLDALYPGRIDLGVGRAPGTDQLTARALRRNLAVRKDPRLEVHGELVHGQEQPVHHPARGRQPYDCHRTSGREELCEPRRPHVVVHEPLIDVTPCRARH